MEIISFSGYMFGMAIICERPQADPSDTVNLSAVILAGGQSRRMGRDKAWIELNDQPLIVRAFAVVREAGIQEILISGRVGVDYSALGCPVLQDLEPDRGPLGGIERALAVASHPLVLVLAVDLPKITPLLLRKLAQHCQPGTGVVPECNGQLEPLAAIYPKRCHAFARTALREGRHSARRFADACRRNSAVRILPIETCDLSCFENWNSPVDVATPGMPKPARAPSSRTWTEAAPQFKTTESVSIRPDCANPEE